MQCRNMRKNTSSAANLHVDVAEGDAAEQGALLVVVKDAKAIGANLGAVHEQVIQRPSAQRHPALRDAEAPLRIMCAHAQRRKARRVASSRCWQTTVQPPPLAPGRRMWLMSSDAVSITCAATRTTASASHTSQNAGPWWIVP